MNQLPNEILVCIFENLDYFDLNLSVSKTCKRFHDIILLRKTKIAKLDQLLFTDEVLPGARITGKRIQHPVFQRLELNGTVGKVTRNLHRSNCHDSYHWSILITHDDRLLAQDHEYQTELQRRVLECFKVFGERAVDSSICCEENALSPACKSVFLYVIDLGRKYMRIKVSPRRTKFKHESPGEAISVTDVLYCISEAMVDCLINYNPLAGECTASVACSGALTNVGNKDDRVVLSITLNICNPWPGRN